MRLLPLAAVTLLSSSFLPVAQAAQSATAAATVPKPSASAPPLPSAEKAKKMIEDAKKDGVGVTVVPHVDSSVNIEAVMLPEDVVRRVFGREVSEHYSVVEVNISNRSKDAGFVLQSLFIDYSHWLLANPFMLEESRSTKDYQSRSSTREISSVEYRIVRGEMLDAQPWTRRNEWARGIKVLGSIGTAFAFPFSRDVVAGINAWNGGVVPGFESLFPDGTDAQINRVSDYGFRDNKIIPQQSSDIVIAFFPIGRFLTPSLKDIFLKSPALLFNPVLIALDPKSRKAVEPVLEATIGNMSVDPSRKMTNSVPPIEDRSVRKKNVDIALGQLMMDLALIDTVKANRLTEQLEEKEEALKTATKDRDLLTRKHVTQADLNTNEKDLTAAETKIKTAADAREKAQAALDEVYKPLHSDPVFNILKQISLENVNVVVSGIMTVDESIVPASITDSCFTETDAPDLSAPGEKACYLKGQFLSGGIPKFLGVNPPEPGISGISVQTDSSTSDNLKFKFTLDGPLSGAQFDIVVTRPGKNGQSVDSMKYRVTTKGLAPLKVDSVTTDKTTGDTTIIGTGFFTSDTTPIAVKLRKVKETNESKDQAVTPTSIESTKIVLSAASINGLDAGDYLIVIQSLKNTFVTTPSMIVTSTKAEAATTPAVALDAKTKAKVKSTKKKAVPKE